MVDFAGLGQMFIGVGALVTAIATVRTKHAVDKVHDQVKPVNGDSATLAQKLDDVAFVAVAVQEEVQTTNGIKLGELGERAEGRRVDEIPLADRTPSEQQYSEALAEGGRDRGHEDEVTEQPVVRDA